MDLDSLVNATFVSLPDGTILEREPLENVVQSDGSIFCNFKGDNFTSADFVVFDESGGEVWDYLYINSGAGLYMDG